MVVTLRDLRPRLEAERLKGEFIAAVSHELRTPLAVILGLAELLKEEVPEGARESVELILEAAFRLKTMVDNLLDTSRLEAGRFEIARRPVDLRPRLLDLAKSFQGVARLSGVAFRVEVEPLPPWRPTLSGCSRWWGTSSPTPSSLPLPGGRCASGPLPKRRRSS